MTSKPLVRSTRVVAAYALGNALEWYDFIVYALLISTMSRLFFPAHDEFTSLLFTFGTFAVSYVIRPLGGIVFGAYADLHGRKKATSVTFLCMAFATSCLGFLPTYETAGILAPILLIVLRLIQGFSAGGEFGSATSALIEAAPPHRKGLYCSFQMATQATAVVLAAVIIFSLTASLSPEAFNSWGWRVPFLIGACLYPVGFYIRYRLRETLEFQEARQRSLQKESRTQSPISELAKDHKRLFLSVMFLFAAVTGPNYINTVYLPSVVPELYGLLRQDAILGVLVAAILIAFFVPFFGWLSDSIGPSKVALSGLLVGVVVYVCVFINFVANPTKGTFLLLQALYAIPYSAVISGACYIAMERFPILVRATGSGTSYNIATIIFGGMTPFWLLGLTLVIGGYGPAIYFIVLSCLGINGILASGRKKQAVLPAE